MYATLRSLLQHVGDEQAEEALAIHMHTAHRTLFSPQQSRNISTVPRLKLKLKAMRVVKITS